MVFISSQKKKHQTYPLKRLPKPCVYRLTGRRATNRGCWQFQLNGIFSGRFRIQPGRMGFGRILNLSLGEPRFFLPWSFCQKGNSNGWCVGKCVVFPGGGFSKYLFFPPRSLGKWSNLTVACVSGWNHQHAHVSSCFDVIQDFFPLEDDRHNLFQANEVGQKEVEPTGMSCWYLGSTDYFVTI